MCEVSFGLNSWPQVYTSVCDIMCFTNNTIFIYKSLSKSVACSPSVLGMLYTRPVVVIGLVFIKTWAWLITSSFSLHGKENDGECPAGWKKPYLQLLLSLQGDLCGRKLWLFHLWYLPQMKLVKISLQWRTYLYMATSSVNMTPNGGWLWWWRNMMTRSNWKYCFFILLDLLHHFLSHVGWMN